MHEANRSSPAIVTAILVGVIYGVVAQLFVRLSLFASLYGVMSFGYVFILPLILGFLTVWYASERQKNSWLFWIFVPWATISLCLAISVLIGWEGAICLIMAAVIYLPLGSIGGIVAGLIARRVDRQKLSSSVVALLLALPLLSSVVESRYPLPLEHSGAETTIDIAAPVGVVWANIIRVPTITEPLDGWFYRVGFPRPIAATLSHEGIGGVRQASFERGLLFVETVDDWQPDKRLSFTIAADPHSVPSTTLDPHVVVGGRYFNVLRGTYWIEPLSMSETRLHLRSDFIVSTRFNFYAGIWASFLMSDIQKTIVKVIKSRCEKMVKAGDLSLLATISLGEYKEKWAYDVITYDTRLTRFNHVE